jgi:hypothetical protein
MTNNNVQHRIFGELHNKPPVFAHAAMADCILSMDTLIKQHCTTDPEMLQTVCCTFGVALAYASTIYKAAVVRCNDDEVIYDYSVEEIDMDSY